MKKLLILSTVVLLSGAVLARGADAKENWDKNCAKCHGADGKGQTTMGKKLKVKDYSDPKVQAEMKDEEIIKTITDGKKDGEKVLMKSYKDTLSEQEIKDLVAFIRSLKK